MSNCWLACDLFTLTDGLSPWTVISHVHNLVPMSHLTPFNKTTSQQSPHPERIMFIGLNKTPLFLRQAQITGRQYLWVLNIAVMMTEIDLCIIAAHNSNAFWRLTQRSLALKLQWWELQQALHLSYDLNLAILSNIELSIFQYFCLLLSCLIHLYN